MNQILHIFAKDVRRFWPEILISLGITAAFVWAYPVNWASVSRINFSYADTRRLEIVANVLTGLVPASWWLLITRVIHAESLVGDRQFWITRPYEWPKLLAAKALFIAAFIYLPFTVAQWALLIQAGFPPFNYLPGLLFNLLFATATVVVPLVAISAVTRNFVRMTLTLLAILLGIVAVAILSDFAESSPVGTPYGDVYSFPLVLIVGISAVVLQYARRKVWLTRALIASALVCIAIAAIVLPTQGMVDAAFPPPAGLPDINLHLSLDQEERKVSVSNSEKKNQVDVGIPLIAEGVPPQHMVEINDVKASIDGPGGLHWTSPWHIVYNRRFMLGAWTSTVEFTMPKRIYEQFGSAPVTLKLTLATTETRAGKATRMPLSSQAFSVPDFGVCPANAYWATSAVSPEMTCRVAFNQPRLTYVTASESTEPCKIALAQPQQTETVGTWVGSLDPGLAEFGITSVWTTSVNLAGEVSYPNRRHHVCPDASLTFTQYELVRRTQSDMTIPTITLPKLKTAAETILLRE